LTRPDGSPAHKAYDVGMQPNEYAGDPRRYAAIVNRALQENPPPAADGAKLAGFPALGIGPNVDTGTLDANQLEVLRAAIDSVLAELTAPRPSALGGGWFLPVEVHESFGDDYFARAQVARNYIGALGIKEAMYIMADRDGEGQPLDGRHAYELYFAPGRLPQTHAFWSITLYDKPDCMLVDNPLDRYSLGDRSPALRHEQDGGLRLFFCAQAPADPARHGNWLPAPAGPFYLTLRLYMPGPAHINKTFVYPPIRRIA
jgi:hypothetical protein